MKLLLRSERKPDSRRQKLPWWALLACVCVGLCFVTGKPAATAACVPAPDGIVGWWPGDGHASDVIGTNHGTAPFGISYPTGLVGRAFHFTSRNTRITIPDGETFKLTNSLSIEGWINVEGTSTNGLIFFRGDNRGGYDPYVLSLATSNTVRFHIEFDESEVAELNAPVTTGQWTHVAATLDGASGMMRLFVDGLIAAQTNTDIRPLRELDPDPGNMAAIGIGNHGGTFHIFPFAGFVDEIALYERALTLEEVAGIHAAGSSGKCKEAPRIVSGPLDVEVIPGATVTFSVLAEGTPLLRYQWSFDGEELPGATAPELVVTNAQEDDMGDYSVRVSNFFGSATETASLSLDRDPPMILAQPQDLEVIEGSPAAFVVVADGTPPLEYQWRFNGHEIPGATDAMLVIAEAGMEDIGVYDVVVSNGFGTTNSVGAFLSVVLFCVTPPPGLIAWWRAESNTFDNVGVHHGTFRIGSGYGPGRLGAAFDFDNSRSRVLVEDHPGFRLTNGLTIEGWIYPRAYTGIVFWRGDLRPGFDPWSLDMYTPGHIRFQITGSQNETAQVFAPAALNRWQHVAATFDAVAGLMRFFTNGVLAAETSTDVRPIGALEPARVPYVAIGNVGDAISDFPFNGRVDELSIYSRALSDFEIESVYRSFYGKCAEPPLSVSKTGANVRIGWPIWAKAYRLQNREELAAESSWINVTALRQTNQMETIVTLPITESAARFFRLQRP